MTSGNTVLNSINEPDGGRCVDIFRRPDGGFGFDEFRRDVEDPSGWFRIGFHGDRVFQTEAAATEAARRAVPWFRDRISG